VYVAIIVMATMLAKGVLDDQTVYSIQTTLDLPTALTLVVFTLLSVKLELDKPKYRQLQKSRGSIDIIVYGAGALIVLALIYLKYFL
jgi:hypothetical protein